MLQYQSNSKRNIGLLLTSQYKYTFRCFAVLAVLAVLLLTTAFTTPAYAQEDTIHVVKAGESLSSIAARYGVNMYALARYNGIRNINLLQTGQVLQIPSATVAPATPAPTRIIVADSTAHPKITPEPTATPYLVAPDQPTPTATMLVPTPMPRETKTRVHVVTAFDTLTSIANLYGTSTWAIKTRNGLASDRIYRGQRLIIP